MIFQFAKRRNFRPWICSSNSDFVECLLGPQTGVHQPWENSGRDDEVLIVNDTNLWQLGYIILYGYIIYYYGYMMLCKWIQQPFSDPSGAFQWLSSKAVTLALFHMQQRRFMACRAMEHVWGTLALAVVSRGVSKPFSLQSIDRTYTEIIRNPR